jgi:non-specific serine/threonine protein kinase/serine/threonine-protein kinase
MRPEQPSDRIDPLPDGASQPIESPSTTQRIGPYKLLQMIGEGGMGEVYLAEQSEPVKRRVALKVVKPGMGTKEVIARFEVERQALAVMDHPGIARVLDAGATETGRPYFVMEHVKGLPITEYCDTHKLPTVERLDLFVALCHAVQHAHQKGVIHRDLKPSNVLVTVPNGHPVPKVIDFGIAKAIGQRLTDRTLATVQGQLMGTPLYMSPEQAEMSGLDVDTRADVYSLGVMLYELLVGRLPLDPDQIPWDAGAIQWVLRETDPPTPSARFGGLGESRPILARLRRTDPGALKAELRGDLDWIVMKAMDKDRTRRYETVNGLALDIRRHLNHEPVLAGPPSAWYRMGKFVRRHSLGVAAGAVVVAGLVLGVVGATVGLVRARRAEVRATREAETARQVSDFLVNLFQVSDPSEARGSSVTAREILDSGAVKITKQLAEQPLVQARLMNAIGSVYGKLGLYRQASPLVERALALRREQLGDDHLEVATSLNDLATLYWDRGEFATAESLGRRAVAIREKALGPDNVDLAESFNQLAGVLWNRGQYAAAESLYRRSLAVTEKAQGPEHQQVAASLSNLGLVYYELGKYAEAEPLFRRALAIQEKVLPANHPDLAAGLNNLALLYWNQERYGDAEPLLRRSVAIAETSLGAEHPMTATAYNTLATLMSSQKKYAEAESLFGRSIAIREKAQGPEHPDLAVTLNNLAATYRNQQQYARAEPLARRALAIWEKALGPSHPDVGVASNSLGTLYWREKKYDQAAALIERALTIWEKAFGPEHADVAMALNNLADVYRDAGELAQAEPLYLRAVSMREKVLGKGHADVAATLEDYAVLLRKWGRARHADSLDARVKAIRDSSRSQPE